MQRAPLRPKQLRRPQWAAPEQQPAVYFTANKLPASLGGDAVLLKFLVGWLNYFTVALNRYLLGKVSLTFTVDSESRLYDPRAVRALSAGFNEEVLRLVRLMP